ncbi:hypothetical protein ANCDUO_11178 [Ancylostoma duodenale]|uniref:Uncharacterized protein n=1 Tax=Ancylostoma duodenale TaxID=51022 RepID=A0A0C2CPD6_9BILA|nr:hypothetical protein ANCDUO_11178 [Ancylostoma duodenale]
MYFFRQHSDRTPLLFCQPPLLLLLLVPPTPPPHVLLPNLDCVQIPGFASVGVEQSFTKEQRRSCPFVEFFQRMEVLCHIKESQFFLRKE